MATGRVVKVWDPFVRVFHWGLAGCFSLAYVTEEDFLLLHSWAGYAICGLLSCRIFWGLTGTPYARFSNFVFPPATVMQYLKDTFFLRAERHLGHNPAGGAMIVVLLTSLMVTAVTGMATYGAADGAGPLASWFSQTGHLGEEILEHIHEFFANFTAMLTILHVGGVIAESLIHRENLARSMLDGYKRAESEHEISESSL